MLMLPPMWSWSGARGRWSADVGAAGTLLCLLLEHACARPHPTPPPAGAKATELMWELKELFDPEHVLNPGVILNKDPLVGGWGGRVAAV